MSEPKQIVIVGASLAGLQAAQTLRRASFEGSIVLIGDEPHFPYDRPPLSKQFLAGAWEEEKLRLRAAVNPSELGLDWMLGVAATGLDLDLRTVALGDGRTVTYDGLILACGAHARSLADHPPGVFTLRGLDDARALRSALDTGPARVCVIGAGFIGAEVAATARERGLDVTMIEAAAAPLVRVLDAGAGLAIAELHRRHGVDVRLGVGVNEVQAGADGRVERVLLADGSAVEADVVVVGIGVVPNTGWLEGSGVSIDNGVVCDSTCLAAPNVVACGDVARWNNPRYGRLTRVEQWDNAVDQGAYVARRLLEEGGVDPEPFAPVPWFWSDQYDRKIQLAGVTGPNAEVVNGSLDEQRFVQLYADDSGRFVGALAWNRPRQAIQARQLLEQEAGLDEARAALGG
ncbi:MAG: FAD/NAD(P)-binding oxidoreductase [Actinomycetota bacterium]|nr:FAD/NAD(P)-binding oxidoreductase [Actinomycetota bacterium]